MMRLIMRNLLSCVGQPVAPLALLALQAPIHSEASFCASALFPCYRKHIPTFRRMQLPMQAYFALVLEIGRVPLFTNVLEGVFSEVRIAPVLCPQDRRRPSVRPGPVRAGYASIRNEGLLRPSR